MIVQTKTPIAVLALAAAISAAPASAEVTRTTDNSFVSRHEVVVEASPKQVWLALITPADWWRSEHTWSGDAKNLTLMPRAGGCFCETIPEVSEPGRFTLEGSAEHMRVVQASPETALRMVGSLGPLQSEPVNGVLTIAISKIDQGTRIVWEYNVGGPMRYEVPVIAKAVDGVMGLQLAALAKPLVVVPVSAASAADEAASLAEEGTGQPTPPPAAAARPAPAPMAAPAPKPGAAKPALSPTPPPRPAQKAPTVSETFGDLGDAPRF